MKRVLVSVTTIAAVVPGLAACGGGGASKAKTVVSAAATGGRTAVAALPGIEVSTAHTSLGTIVVAGPRRLTVYVFEADRGQTSACSGACAAAWPPVTTASQPVAGGGAHAASLSSITRSDGTKQVSYDGHPLYYFVNDKASGETLGQDVDAFGARWHVLSPAGSAITSSGSSARAVPKPTPAPSGAPPATGEAEVHESTPTAPPRREEERPPEEQRAEEPTPPPHSTSMPPAAEGIPQNGGGDGDADNHGGPSDGDGNI